jgi:hypothetical protein
LLLLYVLRDGGRFVRALQLLMACSCATTFARFHGSVLSAPSFVVGRCASKFDAQPYTAGAMIHGVRETSFHYAVGAGVSLAGAGAAGGTTATTPIPARICKVWLDLIAKTIQAKIQRGTVIAGVFVENMAPLLISVGPDGSFTSSDATWSGAVAAAAGLIDSLCSALDRFIVAAGMGTVAVPTVPAPANPQAPVPDPTSLAAWAEKRDH